MAEYRRLLACFVLARHLMMIVNWKKQKKMRIRKERSKEDSPNLEASQNMHPSP
jgi:hypothetical protein